MILEELIHRYNLFDMFPQFPDSGTASRGGRSDPPGDQGQGHVQHEQHVRGRGVPALQRGARHRRAHLQPAAAAPAAL